jgi:hypothetical protein
MKIVLAALLPLSVSAAAGVYSYDPANEYGPAHWADVDVSYIMYFSRVWQRFCLLSIDYRF